MSIPHHKQQEAAEVASQVAAFIAAGKSVKHCKSCTFSDGTDLYRGRAHYNKSPLLNPQLKHEGTLHVCEETPSHDGDITYEVEQMADSIDDPIVDLVML